MIPKRSFWLKSFFGSPKITEFGNRAFLGLAYLIKKVQEVHPKLLVEYFLWPLKITDQRIKGVTFSCKAYFLGYSEKIM